MASLSEVSNCIARQFLNFVENTACVALGVTSDWIVTFSADYSWEDRFFFVLSLTELAVPQ